MLPKYYGSYMIIHCDCHIKIWFFIFLHVIHDKFIIELYSSYKNLKMALIGF